MSLHKYTMNPQDDFDPFVMIPQFLSSSSSAPTPTANGHEGSINADMAAPSLYSDYTKHSSGQRVGTDVLIANQLKECYPDKNLTLINSMTCDLLGFARAGYASVTPYGPPGEMLFERVFVPPPRRYTSERGTFAEQIKFAAFEYKFGDQVYLLYVVDCRDGVMAYPAVKGYFLLSDKVEGQSGGEDIDRMIEAATKWALALHDEVWVFDQGYWHKDTELFKAVGKSSWEDVILDDEKKQEIIHDVSSFFAGEESYNEFAVPWKRGLIFWGPPGNGKTISIKALMNSLSKSVNPTVELLYVKTLSSFGGPEFSIRQIFTKARATAPCLLIFEDIDSLVTPFVRSYFLNEVDGLESNHGILMIGSTNHLERLDPGISKRPSRFDRKYLFSLPNHDERVLYCEYWRKKLSGNEKIDFPKELSVMIADITDEFSFAYMKEAFVASLLSIVARLRERPDRVTSEFVENLGHNEIATAVDGDDDDDDGKNKAERSILWKEIKKQVKNLRDEMDNESVDQAEGMHGITWDLPSRDRASRPVFRGIPPSARPSFAM